MSNEYYVEDESKNKKNDKNKSTFASEEIELKLRELGQENISFITNVVSILGNLGPINFHVAINSICTAMYILQKENAPRHTHNITLLANNVINIQNDGCYSLNRAEVFCLLYYLQQNMETIYICADGEDIPTWSIKDDIFKKLTIELQ